MALTAQQDEIERFLRTGAYDPQRGAWSGDILSRERSADRDLRLALIAEVRRRSEGDQGGHDHSNDSLADLTRRKVGPMVRGLFPPAEQAPVLNLVDRSLVFVSSANVCQVIEGATWLRTAWNIANLYLGSQDSELLGPDAPNLVGISEETTCYLSDGYWKTKEPFDDFLVHEVAHIFHNCKRSTIGLHETRSREWLLDIEFNKRETFAYACEAYSRLLDLSHNRAGRRALLADLSEQRPPPDDRVDPLAYIDILREAVEARNGWKRIHARCCSPRRCRAGHL